MVIKHRLGVLFMSATLSVTVQHRAPGQCQNIMTSVQELLPHLLQQNNFIPYLSANKTEAFSFQNNPKNLDSSYKTDLDLGDCVGRAKFVL